jgi:hypothetical protein
MNISVNVNELIVDAEIRQWEHNGKKVGMTSDLCISTCDGNYIFLKFNSPEKLTEFCKAHNFQLEDKRNESKH